MTDFRKWFVALAVLVVMVGTAYGQAFQCTANAAVPAKVRGEGRTELVGDLLLNCSGVAPADITANIQIFLSTNITSRITSGSETEALLFVGDPLPADQVLGTNVFRGVKVGDNSLLWINIPVVAAGGTSAVVRITNVRANAVQAYGTGQTFIPQQITMFLTVTSSTAIPINNPTQVVAGVLKGLDFAMRNCADSGSGTGSYTQCVASNPDLYGDSTKTGQAMQGLLRFTEGFDAAFKVKIVTENALLGGRLPNINGVSGELDQDGAKLGTYTAASESGYVNYAKYGIGTGIASQATRLIARFASVPAGVKIFVSTTQVTGNGTSTWTGGASTAALVSVTDPTGTGGSVAFPVAQTGTANCVAGTTAQGIVEVPLYGGAGSATWEITMSNTSVIEEISFGVVVAFKAQPDQNLPALTAGAPATVSGNFAPVSTGDKMSSVLPIPRFADLPISATLFTIDPCASTLLFPFVTARAGFDTGMVISNTTLDNSVNLPGGTKDVPFKTTAQSGACTLFYFGDKEDGTSLAAPVQTSAALAGGKQLVYTLFGGGAGIAATPGFQGYIFARCAFELAHGFAFISDLGAQKLAMGYLALVMAKNSGARSGVEGLDQ